MERKIRVGVSSCLLGNPVRYDGNHKHESYLTEVLAAYFEFIPVCPEVECGLPVPREAMQLEGDPQQPRLVTIRTRVDLTEKMLSFCNNKVSRLENQDLCAFIFKKGSPSSGLHQVKVFSGSGSVSHKGRGLFAGEFISRFPYLPVEEEDCLHNAARRKNFMEQVFCCRRWKDFLHKSPNRQRLILFHQRHRLQVMAHSPGYLAKMDRLLSAEGTLKPEAVIKNYQAFLIRALKVKPTAKKNSFVLKHISNRLKKFISKAEESVLAELVESYTCLIVPLIAPLTLVNHYVNKYRVTGLLGQTYLAPYPAELMLNRPGEND